MADIVIDEKALQADVDEAKSRMTDTKALYKWVCALLFFRYGITPTTNRLYQLVRKGSMGTVTTALSTFWQDLREKSRVQIDHPGVPDGLRSAAGDLVQALWEQASIEARTQFEAAAAESEARVTAANNSTREAEAQAQALETEVGVLTSRIDSLSAEMAAIGSQLEDERRSHSATTAALKAARTEVDALRQDLADARRDFAAELEKARAAVGLAEERLEAAERRALAEIDRERTARSESEKQLQRVRSESTAAEQAANARIQILAGENGELGGRLKAAEADLVRRDQEIIQLRQALTESESKAAHAQGSFDTLKERVAEIQKRDPIEHAQFVTVDSMRDFAKVVADWKLSDTEQLVLLDTRDPKRLKSWAAGEQIMPSNSYQRLVNLRRVHRMLDIWVGPKGPEWLRRTSEAEKLKGKAPLEMMMKGQFAEVHDYLAAATSGDYM